MRVILPLLALILAVPNDDAEKEVRKALKEAAEKGYAFTVKGRFSRSGEYGPEPIQVSRIRAYSSIRFGDQTLIKAEQGIWMTPREILGEKTENPNPDPDLEAIVQTLENAQPPHEIVEEFLKIVKFGKKTAQKWVDGALCNGYFFRLKDEEVRAEITDRIERAIERGIIERPQRIDLDSARGFLRVYTRRKDGTIHRAIDEREVRIIYRAGGNETRRKYVTKLTADFRDVGAAVPNVPDAARRKMKKKKDE